MVRRLGIEPSSRQDISLHPATSEIRRVRTELMSILPIVISVFSFMCGIAEITSPDFTALTPVRSPDFGEKLTIAGVTEPGTLAGQGFRARCHCQG